MNVNLRLMAGLLSLNVCFGAYADSSYECLIEPTQSIDVGSPVAGRLDRVYVARGNKVSKGAIIATLEASSERVSTALARYKSEMTGQIKTAETKLEFATRKFQRRRDMMADNFMSEQEREEAEVEMKLAESELHLARENKQLAQLEWQQQKALLNLRTIRSPLNGIVVDQLLYPGETLNPTDEKRPILKLAQLDPLRVHVILPISMFGKIKPGMTVGVIPEAPISGRYSGKVKVVDRLIDAASGTFGVFVELRNGKLNVPAGLKCRATFPVKVL